MPHLDEGLLSAMLDREVTGNERREAEAHLRACADCASRLEEMRSLMIDADLLVAALGEPHVSQVEHRAPAKGMKYRAWIWAAGVLLALGLGFAGSSIFLVRDRIVAASGEATAAGSTEEVPATKQLPESDQQMAPLDSGAGSSKRANSEKPAPMAASTATGRMATPRPTVTAPLDIAPSTAAQHLDQSDSSALALRLGRTDKPATNVDGVPVTPGYRGSGFRGSAFASTSDSTGPAERRRARSDSAVAVANAEATPETPPKATTAGAASTYNQLVPRDEVTARARRASVHSIFQKTTMEEAVRLLAGTIRLIDGLAPDHVDVNSVPGGVGARPIIRVAYFIDGKTLFLGQQRVDSLVAESGELHREADTELPVIDNDEGKLLEWNDMHGFHLTLSGSFSADLLRQLKSRVR